MVGIFGYSIAISTSSKKREQPRINKGSVKTYSVGNLEATHTLRQKQYLVKMSKDGTVIKYTISGVDTLSVYRNIRETSNRSTNILSITEIKR